MIPTCRKGQQRRVMPVGFNGGLPAIHRENFGDRPMALSQASSTISRAVGKIPAAPSSSGKESNQLTIFRHKINSPFGLA